MHKLRDMKSLTDFVLRACNGKNFTGITIAKMFDNGNFESQDIKFKGEIINKFLGTYYDENLEFKGKNKDRKHKIVGAKIFNSIRYVKADFDEEGDKNDESKKENEEKTEVTEKSVKIAKKTTKKLQIVDKKESFE